MQRPWAGICLALIATLLGGCSRSPNATFYALYPREGAVLPSEPLQIGLRRPELPGHLDRPQIVRRTERLRLEFSSAARWGSPLDDMIATTLTEALAQRLPRANVYSDAGAISSPADVLVELEVQRFELHGSRVELHAQVALYWPERAVRATLHRYVLSLPAEGEETRYIVERMSELLARLSDALAETIAADAAAPAAPPPEASPLEPTPLR